MKKPSYFDIALSDFVKNFAYGDGIRRLADLGYSAEHIKEELGCPFSIEEITRVIERHQKEKKENR